MNTFLSKIVKFYSLIRNLLPSELPQGMSEFEAWATSIEELYDLPTKHKDSIRYSFASMIQNLGPQVDTKPKYFFVKTFRAAAAKEIAYGVIMDVKMRQKEAEAKAKAEAAAKAASNESQG